MEEIKIKTFNQFINENFDDFEYKREDALARENEYEEREELNNTLANESPNWDELRDKLENKYPDREVIFKEIEHEFNDNEMLPSIRLVNIENDKSDISIEASLDNSPDAPNEYEVHMTNHIDSSPEPTKTIKYSGDDESFFEEICSSIDELINY